MTQRLPKYFVMRHYRRIFTAYSLTELKRWMLAQEVFAEPYYQRMIKRARYARRSGDSNDLVAACCLTEYCTIHIVTRAEKADLAETERKQARDFANHQRAMVIFEEIKAGLR